MTDSILKWDLENCWYQFPIGATVQVEVVSLIYYLDKHWIKNQNNKMFCIWCSGSGCLMHDLEPRYAAITTQRVGCFDALIDGKQHPCVVSKLLLGSHQIESGDTFLIEKQKRSTMIEKTKSGSRKRSGLPMKIPPPDFTIPEVLEQYNNELRPKLNRWFYYGLSPEDATIVWNNLREELRQRELNCEHI